MVGRLLLGLLLQAALSTAARVRETEEPSIFINIPIEPSLLQSYLNSSLRPRVYNQTGWLSINPFVISSLESPVGKGWWKIPEMGGPIVKTVAHVTQADGSQPGYMIIDMDFGTGLIGWTMTKGCESTQHGVSCRQSSASSITSTQIAFNTSDKYALSAQLHSTASAVDPTLASLALDSHWKYEELADKSYSVSNQTARTHTAPVAFELSSFQSNLISQRHGWPGEDSQTLCQPAGRCFSTSHLQFIDG